VWLICNKRPEVSLIIGRSACDTAIDIKYLCQKKDDVEFGKFIKSSLGTSKNIYDEIEKDRSEERGDPRIQDRIQSSIKEDFATAGFSLDEVKPSDTWGFGKTKDRAKACGMERDYLFIYSNLSRFTHGAWSELIKFHIEESDDLWYPSLEYGVPRPQLIDGASILIVDATGAYLQAVAPKSEVVHRLDRMRDWFLTMAYKHEAFLSQSG